MRDWRSLTSILTTSLYSRLGVVEVRAEAEAEGVEQQHGSVQHSALADAVEDEEAEKIIRLSRTYAGR